MALSGHRMTFIGSRTKTTFAASGDDSDVKTDNKYSDVGSHDLSAAAIIVRRPQLL